MEVSGPVFELTIIIINFEPLFIGDVLVLTAYSIGG